MNESEKGAADGVRCELCGVVRINGIYSHHGVVRCQDHFICAQVVTLVEGARSTYADLIEAGWKPVDRADHAQPDRRDRSRPMNETEREALAEVARVITASLKGRQWNDATPLHFADAILASDWLAQVKVTARAEAKNEGIRLAAQLVRDHMLNETGERVADFLIGRADRIIPTREGQP
jgi:hypothetical protein